MLERNAVKVARCVLKGLGGGNVTWLPGQALDAKNLRINIWERIKSVVKVAPRQSVRALGPNRLYIIFVLT